MLELRDIVAGYGGHVVLHGSSVTLPTGCVTAIVGANGSGKSTLLKTMCGMLLPFAGQRQVDARHLDALSRREIAQRIAYVPQGKNTPEMTVRQMVLHGRFPYLHYPRRYGKRDRDLVEEALRQMGITAWADFSLSSLSGGLRQKAYIALALAQDTSYILLDEPTTYLDIAAQLELMETLRTLADRGKGVAVVLHDLPLAFAFADRIAVLADGLVVMCDTPQAVCNSGCIADVFGVELTYDASSQQYGYRYERPAVGSKKRQ